MKEPATMDMSQLGQVFSGVQVIFCRDCIYGSMLAAEGDLTKLVRPNPAVTYQVYLENGMPVALPVCLGHFTWKKESILAQ